jgi:hypothetical protein
MPRGSAGQMIPYRLNRGHGDAYSIGNSGVASFTLTYFIVQQRRDIICKKRAERRKRKTSRVLSKGRNGSRGHFSTSL